MQLWRFKVHVVLTARGPWRIFMQRIRVDPD